jgi:4-oxalocrotonate tautomerase
MIAFLEKEGDFMPFVRISLKNSRSHGERHGIADCVHRAMVKAIGIPEGDRFQIITEHEADLIYDPDYLNIQRTDGIVIIQITMASGRTVNQKKALFKKYWRASSDRAGCTPRGCFHQPRRGRTGELVFWKRYRAICRCAATSLGKRIIVAQMIGTIAACRRMHGPRSNWSLPRRIPWPAGFEPEKDARSVDARIRKTAP